MANGVVRTDNVKATKNGNIFSGKYYVGETATAIENGSLVKLDGLLSASTNREIYKCVAASAVTDLEICVVATPEVIYDESLTSDGALDQFTNAAGDPITLLMLAPGDILSISDDVIDAVGDAPEVGNYVTIQADTAWEEKAALGGTEVLYGKIIARELYKSSTYLNVVQIIAAN